MPRGRVFVFVGRDVWGFGPRYVELSGVQAAKCCREAAFGLGCVLVDMVGLRVLQHHVRGLQHTPLVILFAFTICAWAHKTPPICLLGAASCVCWTMA